MPKVMASVSGPFERYLDCEGGALMCSYISALIKRHQRASWRLPPQEVPFGPKGALT